MAWAGLPSVCHVPWHRETTLVQAGHISKYQYKASTTNHTHTHALQTTHTRDAHWAYYKASALWCNCPPCRQDKTSRSNMIVTVWKQNHIPLSNTLENFCWRDCLELCDILVFKETSDETDELHGCQMTIGYLPSLKQISAISQTGLIDVETSQLVCNFCVSISIE